MDAESRLWVESVCCRDYSNQLAVNKMLVSLLSYFRFPTRVFC